MTDSPRTKPEVDFYEGPEPTELVIIDLEEGTGEVAQRSGRGEAHRRRLAPLTAA